MLRLLIFIATCVTCISTSAQDLSGSWEGDGGQGAPYLRVVLARCGDTYYGYTYDRSGNTYCQTDFRGFFDAGSRQMKGSSLRFIANNSGHILCNYSFDLYERNGQLEMGVMVRAKGALGAILSMGTTSYGRLVRKSADVDSTGYMRLSMAACNPPKDSLPAKPFIPVPATPPAPKPDTVKATSPVIVPPVLTKRDMLFELKNSRRTDTTQVIITTVPELRIRVFDNGVQDGDIVSILDNGTVVADHHTVTVKPLEFTIKFNPGETVHDIILIAHNVGSLPPNTATLIVEAGTLKYQVTASTDLARNSMIHVVYRPK